MFSNIQTYSSSKLGVHHDLTLYKFECTTFKTMTNLSKNSIKFKIIEKRLKTINLKKKKLHKSQDLTFMNHPEWILHEDPFLIGLLHQSKSLYRPHSHVLSSPH
jgi:hypothetical protein